MCYFIEIHCHLHWIASENIYTLTPPSLTTLEILLLVHTFLWRFGKNFGKISNDTYKDGMGMVIFHFLFHLTQYIRGRKLMIFQFLPFYVVLMITLTKLQFDWLIHEVMRCECHLQYATGSLMLCVVCWISLFRTSIFTQITAKEPSLESMCNIKPLSPNIHIQILQTDLHTSPLTIGWENLIKDQSIFSMVIILLILITYLLTVYGYC